MTAPPPRPPSTVDLGDALVSPSPSTAPTPTAQAVLMLHGGAGPALDGRPRRGPVPARVRDHARPTPASTARPGPELGRHHRRPGRGLPGPAGRAGPDRGDGGRQLRRRLDRRRDGAARQPAAASAPGAAQRGRHPRPAGPDAVADTRAHRPGRDRQAVLRQPGVPPGPRHARATSSGPAWPPTSRPWRCTPARRSCHDPKLRRRLHRVTVPVLVVWGEQDGIAPVAYGRGYADSFPNGHFAPIPDAGHFPQIEQLGAPSAPSATSSTPS